MPGSDIIIDHHDIPVCSPVQRGSFENRVRDVVCRPVRIHTVGISHCILDVLDRFLRLAIQLISDTPRKNRGMIPVSTYHFLKLFLKYFPLLLPCCGRGCPPEGNLLLHQHTMPVTPVIHPIILLPVKAGEDTVGFLQAEQHFFKRFFGFCHSTCGV